MTIENAVYLSEDESYVSADVDGTNKTFPASKFKRHYPTVPIAGYVEHSPSIQDEIQFLEAEQTPRLMREAINGGLFAQTRLNDLDSQIVILRAQL